MNLPTAHKRDRTRSDAGSTRPIRAIMTFADGSRGDR